MLNQPTVESDLNELAIFVKVADEGTFTAAGRALGLPKSTVSRKVASLEERLEIRLIQRTTRKVALTDAGRRFYERCRSIIDAIGDAEREVGDLGEVPRGRLRVTGPLDFGEMALTQPVLAFTRKYPEVRLEFEVSQRVVDLVGEGYDLAIRIGSLRDSTMIARKLTSIDAAIVASPGYLEAHGTPKHPRELSDHRMVVFSPAPSAFQWHLHGPDETISLGVDGAITSNHFAVVRDAVLDGQGIAVVPSFAACEAIRDGRMVQILKEWKSDPSDVHAVYPTGRHLSPTMRAFIDHLIETFGN